MAPPPGGQLAKASLTAAIHSLSIIVLLGVSVATYAYERALLPLYGSSATMHHMNKIVWVVCLLGAIIPALPVWPAVLLGGVLLCAMPQTAYLAAVYTGHMGNPIWGPVLTHIGVVVPVMLLGTAIVKSLQAEQDTANAFGAPAQAMSVPVCRMAIMTLQDLWPLVPILRETSEERILVSIGCIAIAAWVASPFLPSLPGTSVTMPDGRPAPKMVASSSSNNYWRIAILPLLPYMLQYMPSPTLPKPLTTPFLHPTAPLRIMSSVSSPYSGVVVVGEVLPPNAAAIEAGNVTEPHSIRYLRAGHSLLGGVWMGDRSWKKDKSGPVSYDSLSTPLGDSIYGTFVTQEAARLAQVSEGKPAKNALMIGLGTGIAASAFIEHGLSTTVVEIDPAVYQAAKTYFGFAPPEPNKVFISDARGWVLSRTHEEQTGWESAPVERTPDETFDIIVHDCFSGGGVPAHLFSVGFFRELLKVTNPHGVVAVNFAGKLLSDSGRAIVVTLQRVFHQCRAFHDYNEELTDEKLSSTFMNYVFFCTPSTEDLAFRPSVEADYLGSYLREVVLSTLPAHEVDLDIVTRDLDPEAIKKYTLNDVHNRLEDWQTEEALHHWNLMREVLPDLYWETY